MGCPGQARTKHRRKIAVASLSEIRRTAAAANIACVTWPQAAAPSAASPATPCAKHGAQIAHHRPRSEIRFLRQPALEGLTNLARTKTPRKADRNKSDHGKRRRMAAALKVADGGVARGGEGAAKLGLGL
ncbi:myb-like protein J [Dorcoceras hygrometricum]|uniref:Myb-like protein J n=1 Tax=Dorcoceras hygrometricum TaxID=472368 RepID=A0A2Z7CIK4_9LAMI|nr:myb-like protein J [Dorcoceras hygrometricum]